jgi:hypothetical protein
MSIAGRIVGCAHGGVWYEPPGYYCDFAIGSARRSWFPSRKAAEAYRDELRAALSSQIVNLKLQLEAV